MDWEKELDQEVDKFLEREKQKRKVQDLVRRYPAPKPESFWDNDFNILIVIGTINLLALIVLGLVLS